MARFEHGTHPWNRLPSVDAEWHRRRVAMRNLGDEQRNVEIERWISRWEGTPQEQRALELAAEYIAGLMILLEPEQGPTLEELPQIPKKSELEREDARGKRLAVLHKAHRPKSTGHMGR